MSDDYANPPTFSGSEIALARLLFWNFELSYPDADDELYRRPNDEGDFDEGVELDHWGEWHAEILAYQLEAIRAYEPGKYDRPNAGGKSRQLWEDMWPLGNFWSDFGSELPGGPFPDSMAGNLPKPGSGADFIYQALKGIGREFSDLHFREQFAIMVDDLRALEFPRDIFPSLYKNDE